MPAADGSADRTRGSLAGRRLRVLPMRPRDIDEKHRASTPLELLFDLSFVVAVSQAADQLNAALGAGHFHTAILSYLLVFFAIWWAWVNFTWFASAYDVDDLLYRLFTFVQIIGVLILAAGVDSAFTAGNFTVMTIGYVVMRVAMVAQWLRAAAGDPAARPAALRYAACISILQVGWVVRLFLPQPEALWVFYLLGVGEMLVPSYAERAAHGGTPWHPGHIAERYGLFTLIVLGECIAAVTVALHSASLSHGISAGLVAVVAGAVLLVFAVWWWYFENPAEEGLRLSRQLAFVWGYGHYIVLGVTGRARRWAAAGGGGLARLAFVDDGDHGGAGGGGAGRRVSRRDRGAAGSPRSALGRPPARGGGVLRARPGDRRHRRRARGRSGDLADGSRGRRAGGVRRAPTRRLARTRSRRAVRPPGWGRRTGDRGARNLDT